MDDITDTILAEKIRAYKERVRKAPSSAIISQMVAEAEAEAEAGGAGGGGWGDPQAVDMGPGYGAGVEAPAVADGGAEDYRFNPSPEYETPVMGDETRTDEISPAAPTFDAFERFGAGGHSSVFGRPPEPVSPVAPMGGGMPEGYDPDPMEMETVRPERDYGGHDAVSSLPFSPENTMGPSGGAIEAETDAAIADEEDQQSRMMDHSQYQDEEPAEKKGLFGMGKDMRMALFEAGLGMLAGDESGGSVRSAFSNMHAKKLEQERNKRSDSRYADTQERASRNDDRLDAVAERAAEKHDLDVEALNREAKLAKRDNVPANKFEEAVRMWLNGEAESVGDALGILEEKIAAGKARGDPSGLGVVPGPAIGDTRDATGLGS